MQGGLHHKASTKEKLFVLIVLGHVCEGSDKRRVSTWQRKGGGGGRHADEHIQHNKHTAAMHPKMNLCSQSGWLDGCVGRGIKWGLITSTLNVTVKIFILGQRTKLEHPKKSSIVPVLFRTSIVLGGIPCLVKKTRCNFL